MEDNIKKLDLENVIGSINYFPTQCKNAWEQKGYTQSGRSIKNILVIGMGGSALGPHIIESLNVITVPMVISHEYTIPSWVGKETLVFAISYSGTTEETLSGAQKAIAQSAYVVGITAGAALKELIEGNNFPVSLINRQDNPCGQPRYAAGAMMMHMLNVLVIEGLSMLSREDVDGAIRELTVWQKKLIDSGSMEKIYEETKDLKDKMPVLIHGEHLVNLGRFLRNQIHETGKCFAVAHEIPELNHHLMEGLEYPHDNVKNLRVLFFESNLYSDRVQKRFAITKDVLGKQGLSYKSIEIDGTTPLAQALIGMLRGQYLAYALGLIHEKNPSEVRWVNYFKEQLG